MQYREIINALPKNENIIEDTMRKARIPGLCRGAVDKNNSSVIPSGHTQSCGLLKMDKDPLGSPFEALDLEGHDAIILFNDELYFADQENHHVKKIAATEKNQALIQVLKNACSTSYKLADEKELQLIGAVTGRPLPDPVKPDTVFGAASLSKLVLAYIVLTLISSRKFTHQDRPFALHSKLNEILPFKEFCEANKDKFQWKEQTGDADRLASLTVEMALSHTTGLNLFKGYPADFEAEPGKEYVYSGLGIFYLQKVIEELTKRPLEALAREFVFEPNNMKQSTFYPEYELASAADRKEREIGIIYLERAKEGLRYEVVGKEGEIKQNTIPWEKLPSDFPQDVEAIIEAKNRCLSIILDHTSQAQHTPGVIAAFSLRTTAEDYLHFVKTWMISHDNVLRDAFSPRIDMTHDRWAIGLGVSGEDLERVAWGLGWGLELDEKGKPIRAYHSGDMDKYRAWVVIDLNDSPENNKARVYFANSNNGHILADEIISPTGELEHALNYFFKKYGFSRTIGELPVEKKLMNDIDKFLEEGREKRLEARSLTAKEQTKAVGEQLTEKGSELPTPKYS
jgi:CubicO group peptidase (beta-lactamase class C family)